MGSNNKGKGRQHFNVLVPSRPDVILLGDALDDRYRQLCAMYAKVHGEALVPPSELDRDMLLWRTMFQRHRQYDNRHTADELLAVRRICQWTVNVKMKLTNQEPVVVQWDN